MLNAAVDQFAPDGFSDSFGQALLLGFREHFGHDIFYPPFKTDLIEAGLYPRRRFNIGLPLSEQPDQNAVKPIDLLANLSHGPAVGRPGLRGVVW